MPFAYLKDPLFLTCFAGYWLHRWLAVHGLSTPLLRNHLNDVICIPFFVPIMLWACRKLGLRKHDGPPDAIEVIVPLLIWSLLFEIVIPAQRIVRVPTVADPYDVLSYALGALAAVVFWRWYYTPAGCGSCRSMSRATNSCPAPSEASCIQSMHDRSVSSAARR
jgi:hypothetical protein